jgi:hypothetical protein
MNTQELVDPKSWAERPFGSVHLHERRRTRRAVQAATNLAENPGFSACSHAHLERDQSVGSVARIEPDVTFAALMHPHCHQTREQATSSPVVLVVQETTDIDLSPRGKISGVGHIGNERGCGCFVQTVLAALTREPRRPRMPVRRRRRLFWCGWGSHGASRRAKKRSRLSFRAHEPFPTRRVVPSGFQPGMVTRRVRPSPSFPVVR